MSFYEPLPEWSKSLWPFLANHLWQASLFCLFVLAVSSMLRRAPARVRYSLWLLVLTKFVLPAATIASLLSRAGIDFNSLFNRGDGNAATALGISPLLSPVPVSNVTFYAVETPMPDSPVPFHYVMPIQDHGYLYSTLTLIWVAGCLLLLGLWMKKRRALSETIRSGERVHCGREARTLERVRAWLGLRRKVTLIVSSKIAEPGVWGIFRPVVVLPAGVSHQLTDDELEAVMMHEMIHVERWDNLFGVLQRAVCCLLWFHPLVWLLDRQLLAEREQSCDDTVIRLGGASKVYASSITKVCRHSIGWAQPGLSSATGSNLKRRIGRIMAADVKRSLSVSHFALLTMVATVLFALSSVAGGAKAVEEVARNITYSGVDPRFVVTASEGSQRNLAATANESPAGFSIPGQTQDTSKPIARAPGQPVQVIRGDDQIAPPDLKAIAEMNQPGTGNQSNTVNLRSNTTLPAPPSPISAAIIPAAATEIDLSQFVGRYEVDPTKVENFVLDITLERGALWLKPSHAPKRKLLLTGETHLADVHFDFLLTAIQDKAGRVTGLRLDSWRNDITARKLMLPQPSLQGNTTFRLSGHADARIVAVAGSFNNWNQSQFLFSRVNGEWICKVNLPPGKYEYKFIVDGNWLVDPRNPQTKLDDRGNENSVLVSE